MNQDERRRFLIRFLLDESGEYQGTTVPETEQEQRRLLRALFNVRPPMKIAPDFLRVQDEYLKEIAAEKGIVRLSQIVPVSDDIYLWQGDITRLAADAIVNAANSGMTGCYRPNHSCIDNCIHTFAGVQLRYFCGELMKKQGHEEPTGQAVITPAYNLPSDYVIHTVGPIVGDSVTERNRAELASCYRSCLALADKYGCASIAFCCISTGVFRFPNAAAAELAIGTVKAYQRETNSKIKVVFNVFKDEDYNIYRQLLGRN